MGVVSGSGSASTDKASLITSLQTRLQKIVLSWDYLRLLSEFKVLPFPFLVLVEVEFWVRLGWYSFVKRIKDPSSV